MNESNSSPVTPCGLLGPVTPSVGSLYRRSKPLARKLGFVFALAFKIVKELQKHDPSEHRQSIEIAIQPLVFAHDVTRGLQEAAERLRGSDVAICRLTIDYAA